MTLAFTQRPEHIKAEGYNLQIGAEWYRTVAAPGVTITIATRDSLAQRIDQNAIPYNNVLDVGYAWGRTDVSGGEGLDWDPRQIALVEGQGTLDPIRYWDSSGLSIARPEVAGEPYSLSLARNISPSGITVTDPIDLAASNRFIYVADGDTITWYEDWDGTNPVSDTPEAGVNIRAIASSPADTVMLTNEDGDIWVKDPESLVFSEAYSSAGQNEEAQGIWYLQGRFIVTLFDNVESASLAEMTWNGTDWTDPPVVIDTAAAPFWSVVESGPAIAAAVDDGTVRTYTPNNQNDGDMSLHSRARTTMPVGETPILLGSNASVLLIFTTADREGAFQELRLYQAEVLDARFDYVIGQIQLKREWTGAEHEPDVRRNMTNTRDEILFFVNESRTSLGVTGFAEALWRFDLITSGLSRITSQPDVDLKAITIFDEIAGSIDFENTLIVVSDPALRQTLGYMIFPNITFGLNTDITWISTIIEAFNLEDTGAQVELWRSVDPGAIQDWQDPSWILVQRLSSQGSSGEEIFLAGTKARTIALQLRLRATNSNSTSPAVTRSAIRGIPAHRDFIMVVPVNVSDYVTAPGRSPMRIPGWGNTLHQRILDSVGSSVEAKLLDPRVLFRGIVNNVSEPVEYVSERGSVTRYCMVEFRGSRLTATATATGDDGMGLGLMGIATVGIGQSEQPET